MSKLDVKDASTNHKGGLYQSSMPINEPLQKWFEIINSKTCTIVSIQGVSIFTVFSLFIFMI